MIKGKKDSLVYYVGDIGCPNTAKAIHGMNMSLLFNYLGYHVTCFCESWTHQKITSRNPLIEYKYVKRFFNNGKLSSLEWLIETLYGFKLFKLVKNDIKKKKPSYVVLYGFEGEKKLIKFCKKEKIPIILERTDWFEKDDRINFINRNFIHPKVEKYMKKYDFYANGVIAISKYLLDYYKSNECQAVQIPPVFEIDFKNKIVKTNNQYLTLVYSGSIAKSKDDILSLINALLEINKKNIQIIFNIIGPTENDLPSNLQNTNFSNYGIHFFGKMPNEEAKKIIKQADFSVLLRQNKKYSKAGFSTKMAESMSLGVPVICTKVGGSDTVIANMYNGILIENNEYQTLLNILYQLLTLSKTQVNYLKNNAYKSSYNLFSIESNAKNLKKFLESL